MKAFHKAAGAARKRLFRRSVKDETNKMDPIVRTALVEDVAPAAALREELESIEAEINTARENLRQAEEKEVFLGQRSRQYRRALDEQARQLKEQQARLDEQFVADSVEDDEEGVQGDTMEQAELDRKMEKWERDEDALVRIIETHKQILGNCETMRWRLKELEAKRKSCRSMISECTDFLDAAEDLRNELHQETDAAAVASQESTTADQQDEASLPSDQMIQVINEEDGHQEKSDNAEIRETAKTEECAV